MSILTRRNFLGSVAAAGGLAALQKAVMAANPPGTQPGPNNPELQSQNPDSMWPPDTDSKSLVPTFKYPYALANKRVYPGGWSREITVRELPVSKTMAGVNMRLNAGGVRELHWHTSAEWAIMLYGTARITAIDAEGKSFVADTRKNDLWFFPSGVPHSIQGLNPDGCEFLLVFDDGDFSESETVLLSDSINHLPLEVLAKNFNVSEKAFANLPRTELFIFPTEVPGKLEDDQKLAAGDLGKSPIDFAFRTDEMKPTKQTKSGEVKIVDSRNFKITTTTMAMVTVKPGGMRELHWHPNADEWQFFMQGRGRMTVVATGNKARTMDFQAGDVGYVQKTLLHYVENTGNSDLIFIEMFKSPRYQEFSFSEWLAHTPAELVMAHLKIDRATYDSIPKLGGAIMPAA
jgi:oxalate decarboxylase